MLSPAHDHDRHGKHGADRQVDAANQDDQCHTQGHDAQHGYLVQDIEEVAQGQKGIGGQAEHQTQQDQSEQRAGDARRLGVKLE
ncbi:hypothetical protein D3C79_942930 [compost metagenome]